MGDFDFLDDQSSKKTVVLKKPKPKKADDTANIAIGCVTIIAVCFLIGACGTVLRGISGPSDSEAVVVAQQEISSMLRSPSTASFSWSPVVERFGKRGYAVHSYVDAQNAFGAKLRQGWSVRMRHDESGEWEILDAWFHD